ncbi:serine/threonine-protein kinase [Nocardia sp. NPDC059177]|uniref:serine/threonine-protein kinase n=1 Tax=Nocardia sp. NPDC059177 TaxID=3346759 RepID=UPI00367AE4AC
MSRRADHLGVGEVIAGYRIERLLGRGGMGSVYLARHPRLTRSDALKVLLRTDPTVRQRFLREAELVARLEHPNIVPVYDRGAEQDRLWIAMRFIDGTDCAQLLRAGPLAPARAVGIITAVAAGLDHAHRHGIVHRDVKPANILLSEHPDGDRVFVTDFGIAHPIGDSAVTACGALIATPAYAAPEHITGAEPGIRADVYALGCTLFELLTGVVPFARPSALAVLNAHLGDPPPRPSALDPSMPAAFDAVIARAMAKDPADRFAGCGELATAATAALRGIAPTVRARPVRRRRVRLVGVIATVLVVAAAIAATILWRGEPSAPVAAPPPSPSVTPAARGPWEAHQFIVDAFPSLLPPTPAATGHQGLNCAPTDSTGNAVALSEVGGWGVLSCTGDGQPVDRVQALCRADRTDAFIIPIGDAAIEGDESWTRDSGQGRIIWSTMPGATSGAIQIQFRDAARKHCWLLVLGGATGQQLYDRWWLSAPL